MDHDEPPIPSADELAASLTSRVRHVLAAAQESAAEIRARADAEADERALEIRYAAERDAERLLRRAEREAADYLEDARRRIDAFAAGRARRISAAADRLLAHAEALAERAERGSRLRRGVDEVVAALAAAAEAVAAEAGRDAIALPPAGDQSAPVTRLAPRPHAVPDPASDDDLARTQVREIASMLPRRPGAAGPPKPPPEPPDSVA